MLQVGLGSHSWEFTAIAVAGILLASINVFGGFTVTQRMLKMFQRG
jgi:NAD(P) transhydrogenase subunit alpha